MLPKILTIKAAVVAAVLLGASSAAAARCVRGSNAALTLVKTSL